MVFSYDNIVGSFNSGAIGVENSDGTKAVNVSYGTVDSVISDGLNICFDWTTLGDPITLSYAVTVDMDVAYAELTNEVVHSVDNPGSEAGTTSYVLKIGYPIYLPLIFKE